VVVPFTIACAECDQCRRGFYSVCERSNRNKEMADKVFGHATAGLFGYSHLTGGYPGGQAEYVRVPFADFTPVTRQHALRNDLHNDHDRLTEPSACNPACTG
jgi:threonine dehydrogenase-like Zn-dependent dehydrogenase